MKKIKRFKKNFEKSLEEGWLKYMLSISRFSGISYVSLTEREIALESKTCLPSRSSNNTPDI